MSCNSINLFFKNDMKINDLDDLPWNTFLSLSGKKKYTHLCLGVLKYLKPVLILTIILAYSNISGAPKYLKSKPNLSNVGVSPVRSCKLCVKEEHDHWECEYTF